MTHVTSQVTSSLLSMLQEMSPDVRDDDDIIATAVASYLIMCKQHIITMPEILLPAHESIILLHA